MIIRIADVGDAAAVAADHVTLGDRVERVVGAFAVNVRTKRLEQRTNGRLWKDDHVVDEAERGDQFGAVGGSQNGPPLSFQRPDRRVVIDRNNQLVGFLRSSGEVANVADVQQVEAAVRKRHRPAGAACIGNQCQEIGAGDHGTHGVRADLTCPP